MSKDKNRVTLLSLLLDRYKEISEKEAYSLILCGKIRVEGETIKDPKRPVFVGAEPVVIREKYVSRGGYKLERALDNWGISPEGKIVLDAGSSTGGFTDCLLQRGARSVHAVDVGYNQLDYKLRIDPRVNVHERTNIMLLEVLEPHPDFAVADLSFRSLRRAAARILALCEEKRLIALVKPQFEWLDPPAGFDGVVGERKDLLQILRTLQEDLRAEGLRMTAIINSPIRGTKGNREFLTLITPCDDNTFEEQKWEEALALAVNADPDSEMTP